jgi:hypothetical protein
MWPFNRTKRAQERLFVQKISQKPEFTPDISDLLKDRRQLLFACDDLMTPHVGYDLIKNNSRKIDRGFSRHKFDYRIHELSGMGVPLVGSKNSAFEPLKVKGELHSVDSEHFELLDYAYGNGVAFRRILIPILVSERIYGVFKIGKEGVIKDLPHGTIRTNQELGLRTYVSDRMVYPVQAWMYVALKSYWSDKLDGGYEYPRADIYEPRDHISWLPKYFKYPITLNRKK